MPELIEVACYAALAQTVLRREVATVDAPDGWYLKGGLTADAVARALVGRRVTDVRRIGKLLLVDFDDGPTLGLRFGMTGRLIVDGQAGVERLEYGSSRAEPAWNRFTLGFRRQGSLVMHDPRRLGGVSLEPNEGALGPDALAVGEAQLAQLLAGSAVPLKARLMDQAHLAGLGNLLSDEILWRARLDPARPAGSLERAELRRLLRQIRATVHELTVRGGSHRGDLQSARIVGGRCPRCGAELLRRKIGGRTTYSCPVEQR